MRGDDPTTPTSPEGDPESRPGQRLDVLGGFELRLGDGLVMLPFQAQRVVAFLAVRTRPQPRSTVAWNLWSEVSEERAAANLRSALWKLRRAGNAPVTASGGYLDLAAFVARAQRLLSSARLPDDDDVRIARLHGDLLPDWDDDWLVVEREAFRQLRVHALEVLCRRLSRCGRHPDAIHAGQAAVAAEPLRETAQRALVEAHLAEGNPNEAIRQFRLYRTALREHLGLQPSHEFARLVSSEGRLRSP